MSSANTRNRRPTLNHPSLADFSSREALPLLGGASSAETERIGDSAELDAPLTSPPCRVAADERESWRREEEEEDSCQCYPAYSEENAESEKENGKGDGSISRSRQSSDIGIMTPGIVLSNSPIITARGLPIPPFKVGQDDVSNPIRSRSVTRTSDKAPEHARAAHLGSPLIEDNRRASSIRYTLPEPVSDQTSADSGDHGNVSSTGGSSTTLSTSTACEDDLEEQDPAILQIRLRRSTRKVRWLEEENKRVERRHCMALRVSVNDVS